MVLAHLGFGTAMDAVLIEDWYWEGFEAYFETHGYPEIGSQGGDL